MAIKKGPLRVSSTESKYVHNPKEKKGSPWAKGTETEEAFIYYGIQQNKPAGRNNI